MDRFYLILNSLPPDPSVELIEQLRELGWIDGELPAILITGISDSEARIRKTDFEFLGAELEILPVGLEKKVEPIVIHQELKFSEDEDLSFGELSLEVKPKPADFELPPEKEDPAPVVAAPVWELSLEEPSSVSPPPILSPEPSPTLTNKPPEKEIATFAFSLEEEPEPVKPTLQTTTTSEAPVLASIPEQLETFDLEFPDEDILLPTDLETQLDSIEPADIDKVEALGSLSEMQSEMPSESVGDSLEEVEEEDLEEELDPDEDGDHDEDLGEDEQSGEPAEVPKKKKNILLGSGLVIIGLLVSYIYLAPDSGPPEGANDSSGLVNALLSEQEKILKEERKIALASLKKTAEAPTDSIGGKFSFKLSDDAINGEIRFGRYQAGLLIDSLSVVEKEQQKLSPQELAASKIPRPWIKSFEVQLPPTSAREPLGARYKFKSESRAYIEDSAGTLRIPCMLELDCEFKAGANLSCNYEIKNKALYKEPLDAVTSQDETDPVSVKSQDLTPKKAKLVIERETDLGFLVMISGNFATKLNPEGSIEK